jgi:hypothetical protein
MRNSSEVTMLLLVLGDQDARAHRRPTASALRGAASGSEKENTEPRPGSLSQPQAPAEALHDLAADREPEPGARRLLRERVAHLAELLEDHRLVLAARRPRRCPRTSMRTPRPPPTSRTSTRRLPGAELHRVGEQVEHHLHHAVAVGDHRGTARAPRLDATPRLLKIWLVALTASATISRRSSSAVCHSASARLELGQVEHLVDEAREALGLLDDEAEEAVALRGIDVG